MTAKRLAGALVASAVMSCVTLGLVPLVASASVVTNDLGAFDTPFQPAETTLFLNSFFGSPLKITSTLPEIVSARRGAPDLFASQTSVLAAPYIFDTGEEVLPIGGYTGTVPEPSVARIEQWVAAGQFHLVLAGPTTADPRIAWIAAHCINLPQPLGTGTAGSHHMCVPTTASRKTDRESHMGSGLPSG
jgi:hypothetical protein